VSQPYDPRAFEPRWQRRWLEERTFAARQPGDPGFDPGKPKYYVLDMFPTPRLGPARGPPHRLHRQRHRGPAQAHGGASTSSTPWGWDAFGLPAEQYAITTGKHPAETTRENVDNFRRQLRLIGLSFDWDREFSTADPRYYRWTQWIFARLFDRGLVYQAEVPVWWCEELKTVLANEEVINGRSERGDFPCVRRPLQQWMLRITAYADRPGGRPPAGGLAGEREGHAAGVDRALPGRRGALRPGGGVRSWRCSPPARTPCGA
jgi:leucyl-tRNA synthetase